MAVFFDPFRELDRVAANLLDTTQGPRLMPIDLYRDGDHYILNADLPGIDPGTVDVDCPDGVTAVEPRVDVATAREHQRVDQVEQVHR